MKLTLHRYRKEEAVFFAIFYLLVFQNPLTEYISPAFTYVDELFALLGIAFAACKAVKCAKIKICKSTAQIVVALVVFVLCGIGGNVLFRYQPAKLVLKDLYANLKFFLATASGFYLMGCVRPQKELLLHHTKLCTMLLFTLLLADLLFSHFPDGGYRYGLRVHNLIFGHVTYLAAACVFLLSVLLLHYDRRNLKYMAMALLVLISTLRGKALAGTAAYVIVLYFVVVKQKRMKLRYFLLIGALGFVLAWDRVSYYYIELSGQSARSVLTQTAFAIMKDYFPIGTGFGTFGSDVAGQYYSPVYVKYGFLRNFELQKGSAFFSDTFWPIIIGQTGFLGTVSYITALTVLFLKTIRVRAVSRGAYAAVLFLFIYLLVSSTSEPTFCNAVSIPPAMLLGYALALQKDPQRRKDANEE